MSCPWLRRWSCVVGWCLLVPSLFAQSSRPDIVVIMADDMGYSDLGCFGSEIRTPHLDGLARDGLRLTNFYNNGRCCPTRASLLTGLWPHQAGIGLMMSDLGHPGYRGDLNEHCVTLAEVLATAGYHTAMAGKWHVTKHLRPEGDTANWPRQRGFSEFFGTITGAGSLFDPWTLTRDNTAITPSNDFYYTDAISDEAVRVIRDHHASAPQSPLFLYVAHVAPHWPMQAKPSDIARYRGRYDGGWDRLRRERHARMTGLALVDPRWRLSERDRGVPPWDEEPDQEWQARRMEVYAAMVDCLDQGVGRIVSAVRETGRLDNTMIVFLADNGGCAEEYGSVGPVKPPLTETVVRKPMGHDELQTRMIPTVSRDGRPVRVGRGVMPGAPDTFVAYGKPWANASNTPFRYYKHYGHEGGIASPFLVHWPSGLQRRGELDVTPAHVVDLMATFVDVAQASYPKMRDGESVYPMEGTSLVPLLRGEALPERALFFEHHGNRAVRRGRWKLAAVGEEGPFELYDLERDRSETKDLATTHPERVKDLAAEWQRWAERCFVLPMNPRSPEKFSRKKRFVLEPTAVLKRGDAPDVRKKALTITARLETVGEGVVVAQGGSTHGWCLTVENGYPAFVTRRGGVLRVHRSETALPAEACVLVVTLTKEGDVVMKTGDVVLVTGKEPGPLLEMPLDGLEVGRDLNGAVGRYDIPHPFTGQIRSVLITLE